MKPDISNKRARKTEIYLQRLLGSNERVIEGYLFPDGQVEDYQMIKKKGIDKRRNCMIDQKGSRK